MLSVHTTVLLASIVALVALVVLSAIPRGDNAPKRGIIMMYCTPNIAGDWARYTIEVNRTYARRHNYAFVVVSTPYDPRVTHAWQKIPAMIELLDRGSYAFVVYMDADAIVNKHEVPYERFLERYSGDIIVCSDEANSAGLYAVNGGMVIARNTSAARTLLAQWWALRYAYPEFAFEQWALSDIVRGKHPPHRRARSERRAGNGLQLRIRRGARVRAQHGRRKAGSVRAAPHEHGRRDEARRALKTP